MLCADMLGAVQMQYFSVNGVDAKIVPLPTMEANKSFDLVFEIARQAESFKLNRCSPNLVYHACRKLGCLQLCTQDESIFDMHMARESMLIVC